MAKWPAHFAIAVTLTDAEPLPKIRKALRLQGGGTPPLLLEIRIDRFRRLDEKTILQRIQSLRKFKLPLIATIRSRKEGGGRAISDSDRLRLFKKILPSVDAVDLELKSARLVKALAVLVHRRGKRVILSYHNFKSTPPERVLKELLQKGKRQGADLVKLAVTPKREEDLGRFLLFTHRNRDRNLIAIAMGKHGVPSRVLAPLFGSRLTYSFLGRAQAPGQLSLAELSQAMKSLFKN